MFEDELRAQLRSVFGSRPWIYAGEVTAGAARVAQSIRDAGAGRVLAVAATRGAGAPGSPPDVICLDRERSTSTMANIRGADHALRNLDAATVARIDDWDPDGIARSIGGFTAAEGMLAARRTYGARRAVWEAFEDKVNILDLWDAAGVETAPAITVELDDPAQVRAAHDAVRAALGSVWAGDNKPGWHGGGTGTVWVGDTIVESTRRALAATHDRARVMGFVEGIPCSIHGMVIGGTTIAFRPCEMVVLRDERARRFAYGRAATFWDPAERDREQMRAVARRIGDELHRCSSYVGAFTVDGVMGAAGFVPTEVNPRYGAALPLTIPASEGPPIGLYLVNLALVEGDLDVDPAELEAWVVEQLDRHRSGSFMIETPTSPSDEAACFIGRHVDGRLSTDGDAEPLAEVTWTGGNGGHGLLFITPEDRWPTGVPSAPLVASIIEAVTDEWTLDMPTLTPARSVR